MKRLQILMTTTTQSKRTLLVVVSILISITLCLGQKSSDWTQNELKGKVKSVIIFTYDASERFGEVVKGKEQPETKKTLAFNQKGNLLEEVFFEDRRKMVVRQLKRVYSYNSDGILFETNTFNESNQLFEKCICKSDISGNIIERNTYDSEGRKKSNEISKFDSSGKEIESIKNSNQNETTEKYKYDSKGNLIEGTIYLGESEYGKQFTKFDAKGTVIEDVINIDNLKIRATYQYIFDEQGNWLSKTCFKSSSSGNIKNQPEVEKIIERVIDYYN